MKSLRRTAATLIVTATLAGAGLATTASPAAARTGAPANTVQDIADQDASVLALYCGYDDAVTPRTIRRGSTGNTVREAQCLLVYWGFSVGPSGIDGDFGTNTHNATIRFQRSRGLTQDGAIGPNTWRELRDR
ncbi:peptidoglycan-binding domain-containing protein [Streptomyces sp. NPDC003006]